MGSQQEKESAGKTLEEMDFLFTKDRSPWVFKDREATKIGAIFQRDMASGQALTAFDLDKTTCPKHVENVVDGEKTQTSSAGEV